jgi:hypothetical protein
MKTYYLDEYWPPYVVGIITELTKEYLDTGGDPEDQELYRIKLLNHGIVATSDAYIFSDELESYGIMKYGHN